MKRGVFTSLALRWTFLLTLAALLGEGTARAAGEDCATMQEVPFAGGFTGKETWRLMRSDEAYCLLLDDGRLVRLKDVIPLSVERVDKALVVFGRRRISNYLAALHVPDAGSPALIDMTFDQLSKLHLEGTFVLGGSAYLLAYDVAYSLPSGRRRVVPKEVHALYRVELEPSGNRLALVKEEYLNAGLEAGLRISVNGRQGWLCSGASCERLSIGADNKLSAEPSLPVSSAEKALEVLELVSDQSGEAYALAGLTVDDRTAAMPTADVPVFFLCHLAASASCKGLAANEVPYRLRIEDGSPKWDVARNTKDIPALLAFDLPRVGLNGVANFAENNLEGRLAWSQSNYLNGLLSMLELSNELRITAEFRTKLQQRFIAEAGELAALAAQPYPGFMVKRYSLDREPLTSLLHIGRILKPVWRGAGLLSIGTMANFGDITQRFAHADGAIEVFTPPSGGGPTHALMRKHIPFWSDGADLPWNLRSAWIEGLAWAPGKPPEMADIARSLAEDFIVTALKGMPEKWPYAAGNTQSGWTAEDNVSSNTPVYGGDTSNPNGAHVSYRSMDALAVLAAGRTAIIVEDPAITRHLGALVSRGLLYPFVNEEFAARGRPMEVPLSVGRIYARAKLPWQVQNQPWALLSLPQK
jgi:hypothetical protein